MPRALNVAQTGRPGAVLIDVPMDVFSQQVDARRRSPSRAGPNYERRGGARRTASPTRRDCWLGAKAPVIFAGNGVHASPRRATSCAQLAELLERAGRDDADGQGRRFPSDHPLSLGMTGIWGTRVANDATRAADVILAVGTAFGEADCSSWNPRLHVRDSRRSRLIQIDIDPQEIGKIYPVEVGLVGDAKATLRELIRHLRAQRPHSRAARAAPSCSAQKAAWQQELAVEQRNGGKPIHPARLLNEISRGRARRQRCSSPTSAGTRTARASSSR